MTFFCIKEDNYRKEVALTVSQEVDMQPNMSSVCWPNFPCVFQMRARCMPLAQTIMDALALTRLMALKCLSPCSWISSLPMLWSRSHVEITTWQCWPGTEKSTRGAVGSMVRRVSLSPKGTGAHLPESGLVQVCNTGPGWRLPAIFPGDKKHCFFGTSFPCKNGKLETEALGLYSGKL